MSQLRLFFLLNIFPVIPFLLFINVQYGHFRLAAKRYKVECNAFAKNIIVDSKASLGSIKFEYQNGGEIVSEE